MSGGTYGYLYEKSLGEALQRPYEVLEAIRDLETTGSVGWFEGRPQGERVLAAAAELRAILAAADVLEARLKRLAPVLKAMEWAANGDWGSERVGEAAAGLEEAP